MQYNPKVMASKTIQCGSLSKAIKEINPDILPSSVSQNAKRLSKNTQYQQELERLRRELLDDTDAKQYFNELKRIAIDVQNPKTQEVQRKAIMNVLGVLGLGEIKLSKKETVNIKYDEEKILKRLRELIPQDEQTSQVIDVSVNQTINDTVSHDPIDVNKESDTLSI